MFKNKLRFIDDFRASKWIWIFFVCFLMAFFLVLTSEVRKSLAGHQETIGALDRNFLRLFVERRIVFLNEPAINFTALGSGSILTLLTVFLSTFFFLRKQKAFLFRVLGTGLGALVLSQVLKRYFERGRPDVSMRLVEAAGFSYPSGHAVASSAIYFTVAIIVCKSFSEGWMKNVFWVFFLGLILLVGWTRVYLGVHYFSDVLAGMLIGVSWAALVEFVAVHFESKELIAQTSR